MDGESYIGHSHTGKSQREGEKNEDGKIETQTEGRVRGLYTYLQKSTSVYNTTQQEEERGDVPPFQNKSKNILCVYLTVHIYTRTNKPRGRKGRAGSGWVHVMGYGL